LNRSFQPPYRHPNPSNWQGDEQIVHLHDRKNLQHWTSNGKARHVVIVDFFGAKPICANPIMNDTAKWTTKFLKYGLETDSSNKSAPSDRTADWITPQNMKKRLDA
jgi:hypothetical protein